MPIYPYICYACGHEFDQLQKIGDEPLQQCPECREEALRKKLTAPSFRLKGTGWYETDFKDKRLKKDGDKEGDNKETKDKSDDAKSTGKDDKKDTGKKAESKPSSTDAGSDSAGGKPSTSKSADST